MKKYNKADSNWVFLGLVLPILMFFISINFVYAYFTATANSGKAESVTGIIRVGFTDTTTEELNENSITGSELLLPGDVLKIKGEVENKGNSPIYSILKFEVNITKGGNTLKKYSKYYTMKDTMLASTSSSDNNLAEINGTENNYTNTAFYLEAPSTEEGVTTDYTSPFELTYDFDGEVFDNTYQGALVNYTVTAYAIQTVNLTNDVAETEMVATNMLMDKLNYKNLVLLGNSYQPKSTGKNLFNKETATLGKNLSNESGNLYDSAVRFVSDYIEVDSSKQYTIDYTYDSQVTRYFCCYDKDKNYLTDAAYTKIAGNSKTFTVFEFLNAEVKYIRINGFWNEDGSASELNSIMLLEGNYTEDTMPEYEPYTGGVAGPNSNYPIEVQSLGDKTINLLPTEHFANTSNNLGVSYTNNNDGTISVNGTSTGWATFEISKYKLNLTAGKKYGFTNKGDSTGVNLVFAYLDENGATQYNGNNKEWDSRWSPYLYLQVNPNDVANGTVIPMLVEYENMSKDYEPYGYKIEYTKTSKNLVNPDIVEIHTVSSDERLITTSTVKVKKNTVYVISVDSYSNSSPKWAIKGWDTEQKNLTISEAWSGGTSIASVQDVFNSGDYEYITIRAWNSNKYYGIDSNTKIQIEEGATATDYVPYHENSTGVIYLDEPLRRIGDVADYIDFATGAVVHRISSYTFKDMEDTVVAQNYNSDYVTVYIKKDNSNMKYPPITDNSSSVIWCTHLPYIYDSGDFMARENEGVMGYNGSGAAFMLTLKVSTIGGNTKEDVQDWLQQQVANGTPLVVYYETAEDHVEYIDLPDIGDYNKDTIFTFNTTLQPSDVIIDA